jgi:hypothetical protein
MDCARQVPEKRGLDILDEVRSGHMTCEMEDNLRTNLPDKPASGSGIRTVRFQPLDLRAGVRTLSARHSGDDRSTIDQPTTQVRRDEPTGAGDEHSSVPPSGVIHRPFSR